MMGAPGAGKGTQARLLASRRGLTHVSTGDMLRQADEAGTEVGRTARRYMNQGQLVPDDIMVGLVAERLARNDCGNGFVLDGFPRTVRQAESFAARGQALEAVIALVVPEAELVERLSGRRVCRRCGTMYHLSFSPPTTAGRCDRCDGELYQREDDLEQTIRERMAVYARDTAPVLEHYRRAGLLREVSGSGDPEEVFSRVTASLQ